MNPVDVTTKLRAALDGLAPEPPAGPSLFDRVRADVARRRARRASVLCGLVVLVVAGGIGVTVAPRATETSGPTAGQAAGTGLPIRPATTLVPSGTTAITVVLHTKTPGLGNPAVPARTFGPETVTDRAQIEGVVALVNRVATAAVPEGPVNCPADRGGTMEVTFTGPAGIATARLRVTLSGCRSNRLEMPDGTAVELANDGAEDLGDTIRGLLGLNWTWQT
ncbi:hypothetical protein KZZ52_53240 [Dactylosporangium sp. AC04546]|uniref:hypothetical protein n=1 Tax=Dactylosporangium sp. AC04546 TaxID=2862460 RepID=UPI001EE0EE36|nr:hypothetical protein [Dactylosporangium sp. AC04546]WVK82622.1 hypothetical protein KZZ52_53240 [Dactylosporangium sp. AC04546]